MVTQRRTSTNSPRGRLLRIEQEPLAPEIYTVKWGKAGVVAIVDLNNELIEIDPSVPGDVSFAVQLFIAEELNLSTEELAAFTVEFKRIR